MTKPTAPPLGEFERIARFFAPLAGPGALNLTDDVALIDGPAGEQYALTTDTIIEGVDYFPDDPPFQVAQKLLRVNLSDIAAKAATPFGYLLTTALPRSHGDAWLEQFTNGLAADQKEFGVMLLGGDSSGTPGPATLTLALIGKVATGRAVLRSTARAGDHIYVSGTLGDSALGLAVRKGEIGQELSDAEREYLVDRYRVPRPRVALGPRLGGIAHAMIDISDGLLSDLGHVCAASRVRGVVRQPLLPLSPASRTAIAANPTLNIAVTGGGDDYELLFTAPAGAAESIAQASAAVGVPVIAIGAMEKGDGVALLDAAGREVKVEQKGYAHFS
jgi:thiamine-monophosphate kinase